MSKYEYTTNGGGSVVVEYLAPTTYGPVHIKITRPDSTVTVDATISYAELLALKYTCDPGVSLAMAVAQSGNTV